jgi:predicted hotdog family 3-hydroxylacyl-ACP dehydratase
MHLKRAWIEAHIPHKGRMCLLDEVIEWNNQQIRCRTASHRAPDNPLRAHDRLGTACGIEYAAQTMAVHDALAGNGASGKPAAGFLASVRAVRQFVPRLDDIESDLICQAGLIAANGLTALYEFALLEGERNLLTGRLTVVLNANPQLGT